MSSCDLKRYRFHERAGCPACRSARVRDRYRCDFAAPPISGVVARKYRADPQLFGGAEYRLVDCADCQLVFQAYVGSEALLSDLYTHWVDQSNDPEADLPTYLEEISRPKESRDAHEIMCAASYLGVPLNELKTLDYGMGWALWARIAAILGCRSFGTDLSEPRMEYARRHGVQAITDGELKGAGFHFINTEQVFEHIPEPRALMALLAAALAPGGVVKVSVPSNRGVARLIGQLNEGSYSGDLEQMMPVMPLEHVNCFTHESLVVLSAQHGLQPVRPGLLHGYAFLRSRGTVNLRRPKKVVKELVRPWYQYRNPANLYVWMRKGP